MPNKKHHRTEKEKRKYQHNLAKNKIKHIKKSLETAGGNAIKKMEERLSFWREQL